jgi:hypothetical protein
MGEKKRARERRGRGERERESALRIAGSSSDPAEQPSKMPSTFLVFFSSTPSLVLSPFSLVVCIF